MKPITACLVVHPRSGINLAKVPDVVAVFAAAGWTTDVVIKAERGQTVELAARAADAGYDRIVAFGGDGTLNHVINGVLAMANKRNAVVGLIPGGTANIWAAEVGIPADPVLAAKSLVESDVRSVDVGHVGVESVTLGAESTDFDRDATSAAGPRRHFLLMAGLGADASLMRLTPAALKHRLGVTAVVLTALRHLPALHLFPLAIRAENASGVSTFEWQGRALQLVVGNTRLYGKIAMMTPDAQVDNGELDLSVITARSRLSAFAQVVNILMKGRPTHADALAESSGHFQVSAPASVDLQLDGSAVKLQKYLTPSARDALARAGDPARSIVHYRFDAIPGALRIAVPREYDGSLFARKR